MEAQPQTTTPIEEQHSFSWKGFIVWPLVILMFYVLSSGPILMMMQRQQISTQNVFVVEVYWPLLYAYKDTQLHKPLGMYFHVWAPKVFDKGGDWQWPSSD